MTGKVDHELMLVGIELIQHVKPEKIEDGAQDILSWIQDAVGDMANEYHSAWADDKWNKKIKQAKKDKVIDIKGWLADEYYNDVGTLQDLCGDRIHDKCIEILGKYEKPHNDIVFILLCMEMKRIAHPALIQALGKLVKPHMENLKKWKKTLQKPTS